MAAYVTKFNHQPCYVVTDSEGKPEAAIYKLEGHKLCSEILYINFS